MSEADKVLEAEQSIQNIAVELTRMRDAAHLLQGAQVQSDAIISAAKQVIKATENFTSECGIIVSKLSSTDFNQKFSLLHDKINENIRTTSSSYSDDMKATREQLDIELKQISRSLEAATTTICSEISNLSSQVKAGEATHAQEIKNIKKRTNVIILVTILIFLAGLGNIGILLIRQQ